MSSVPLPKTAPLAPATRQRAVTLPAERLIAMGLSPALARIYASRICDESELDLSLAQLPPPLGLSGIDCAAARLARAVQRDERILISGDYDCDGATATAVLVAALGALGAKTVSYVIPDRVRMGYGLTCALVDEAAAFKPDLLITVDSGISSFEGVARATELGWDVIVTDHHLPGVRLPEAYAIVNPNLPGERFPSRNLAGVGVAFYLALATRAGLRESGTPPETESFSALLDLVALGTVADVVALDHTNRILVEAGLRRIRAGKARPGIAALIEAGGRDARTLTSQDIAFGLGPLVNAAGRLADMRLGIECLLERDTERARGLARQLAAINTERREIERTMREEASVLADAKIAALGSVPDALCLYDSSWHEGVVGLVAGRVKERLHRPVIAFARGASGLLKGSARSIPGVHVRDALALVDARHPGLIDKFGGHAMAAGLGITESALPAFEAAFAESVGALALPSAFSPITETDGALAVDEITMETADALAQAGPWGQGFPEPLFDGEFEVAEIRYMGGRHARLTLRASGKLVRAQAVAFHIEQGGFSPRPGKQRLLYRLRPAQWNGERYAQMVIEAAC
ncbi:MAG: single-stranded-DNA-specific exonuclease RecJ [Acidiferrobacterales bacterium]